MALALRDRAALSLLTVLVGALALAWARRSTSGSIVSPPPSTPYRRG